LVCEDLCIPNEFGLHKKIVVDPNLYYNIFNGESLILVLYVDDLLLTSTKSLIGECKYALAYEFEMKDPGMMHYFFDAGESSVSTHGRTTQCLGIIS
jgi:hypothetical protein